MITKQNVIVFYDFYYKTVNSEGRITLHQQFMDFVSVIYHYNTE